MSTLDCQHIMDLYNQYERKIKHEMPNAILFSDENIIKYVYEDTRQGFINFFEANTLSINELINREVNFFKERNISFEWKTYATDNPKNIGEMLLSKGFIKEDTESFLVRPIKDYKATLDLPSGVECKIVNSKKMFRQSFEIQNTEFPLNVDEHVERNWNKFKDDDTCSMYVVYENHQPVATARIDFTPNSIFAGLYAGTTLEKYRGRGYYQILLNYRIFEAQQRNRDYVTIDALETSRPIVQKHGFKLITTTTPYIYSVD